MRRLTLARFLAILPPIAANAFCQYAGLNSPVTPVTIPVVVRDTSGKIVAGLTKDDFRIFDRGAQQVISKFSLQYAEAPSRYLAYVFDDLNGDAADLDAARKAAEEHIARTLRPEDRAAIFTTSGLQLCGFTADRAAIHRALAGLKVQASRILQDDCLPMDYYTAGRIIDGQDRGTIEAYTQQMRKCLGTSSVRPGGPAAKQARDMLRSEAARALRAGDDRTAVVLHSLREAVRRLSRGDGEHLMVLASPGFYIADDFHPEKLELMEAALRANVKIGALVDGVSLSTTGQPEFIPPDAFRASLMAGEGTLAEFAHGTGGRFIQDTDDLAVAMDRAVQPPGYIYTLEFSPANLQADGKYHELKIALREDLPDSAGYTIEARTGYYAPGNRAQDPMEQVKPAIRFALYSRQEQQQIPVELNTKIDAPFKHAKGGTTRLSLVARVNVSGLDYSKVDGLNRDLLVIVAGVFDPTGTLVDSIQKGLQLKLKDETLKANPAVGVEVDAGFDLKPGKYLVRFILSDTEGQQMTARNLSVVIP